MPFFFLVLGLGFRGGGFFLFLGPGYFLPGVWGSSCSFLFLLVHYFLLVLGLGLGGGFCLFWGPGWISWGLGFFWFLLVPFLILLVPFFFLVAWVVFLGFGFFSCPWWSSCACFFLFLFVLLIFLVPFLFLLVPFLLVLGGPGWLSCGSGLLLFLSCLLFLFLFFLFWGALGGFPGVGVSSCSFIVCSSWSLSSCLFSSCLGFWGFFLFLSCLF